MFKKLSVTITLIAVALLLSNCGKNLFGPGAAGGLSFFAKVGKAMQKPAAIEKEESSKEGSKAIVAEASSAAKRLAKCASGTGNPSYVDTNGIIIVGDTLTYFEVVTNKPSEEDPLKLVTGRGEVKFGYSGGTVNLVGQINPASITDVYSWHFLGRENKLWKTDGIYTELCSLNATVQFSVTSITDFKPGKTWFWAMNISETRQLGRNDTASFELDSLDDLAKTQYGSGHFYDAYTGNDNEGDPNSFNFNVQVIHKNSLDAGKPYHRYEDNHGRMNFKIAWGTDGDSLYFDILFMPDYEREGDIYKNGADGPKLVHFTHNEKTGAGTTTIYDEEGNVVDTETN